MEGDDDTVTKASVHLESFVEEMNCRTTGGKASIFPGKSAADILSAVKGRKESHSVIDKIYKEFVEAEKTLTKLHSCAKRSDVEMAIELVLNDGIDVNVPAETNFTPLLWASPAASSLSIITLIDLGADVSAQTFLFSRVCFLGRTALHAAIHGNNAAVVKVLLANNADAEVRDYRGHAPLHISSLKGFTNISQLLIDSGCIVNRRGARGETPLQSAVRSNNLAHVELLLKNNANADVWDYSGDTPLHISSLKGFTNISQLLIDSGCEINARNDSGESPLHSAVRSNNLAHVELLLKNNANADVQDTWGKTPLHISTREGFSNISQLLIDSGCMVNRRDCGGKTPLHSAVRSNNLAHVELLLKNNANADVQDTWGETPLHISTREGFSSISQLLIDSGCNKNLKNKASKTPLDVEPSFLRLRDLEGFRSISLPLKLSRRKSLSSQRSEPQDDDEDDPRMDEPTLSSPIIGKPVKEQCELSSSEEYETGATRKHLIGRRGLSRRVSSGKDDPRMNQPTLSTLPSPILGKLKEESSAEGSGTLLKDCQELSSSEESKSKIGKEKGRIPRIDEPTLSSPIVGKRRSDFLLKKQRELSSSEEYETGAIRKRLIHKIPVDVEPFSLLSGDFDKDKGNKGYTLQKSSRHKIFLESEVQDDPWMNQLTPSTPPSPILGKLKEQSSAEGSGILLKDRQELSSSEESKS